MALGCGHGDRLDQQVEQLALDVATVALNLTDDVFLHSSTWVRWPLAILLPQVVYG